jgi:hypothetical protein
MCGPADFEALQTSITRLLALWAAGIAAYAVRKALCFYRERRLKRHKQEQRAAAGALPRFAVQGSGERSNS